jgi:hypothetical protein
MALPFNFNYKDYLFLNPDLNQNCSYDEAVQHYLIFGCNENRKYCINPNLSNPNLSNPNLNSSNIHILVVIVSCNKNFHLYEQILNRTNNEMIFLFGTNNKGKYYDKEKKILYLDCNDKYEGLPEKIILMIEEVLTNPAFSHITHILKIDDHDNFFNDETIKNIYKLPHLLYYDYIGQKLNRWKKIHKCTYHFGKVSTDSYWHNRTADISNIKYFDGGCSYILNRKAMKKINNVYNSSNIDMLRISEIYEDLMIGRILQKSDIKYKKLNYGIIGDK